MLVRGPQGDATGMRGILPGGGGGDHSGSMPGVERWGAAAQGSGGVTARGEEAGSRGADAEGGCLSPDAD